MNKRANLFQVSTVTVQQSIVLIQTFQHLLNKTLLRTQFFLEVLLGMCVGIMIMREHGQTFFHLSDTLYL